MSPEAERAEARHVASRVLSHLLSAPQGERYSRESLEATILEACREHRARAGNQEAGNA